MTNKTSEAVERYATEERCTQCEVRIEELVAISAKYKRMEEALPQLIGFAKAASEQLGGVGSDAVEIGEESLAFDPLRSSPNSLISSAQ